MKYKENNYNVMVAITMSNVGVFWGELIEKDYDLFTANNSTFTHIKVDCDATPKVKFYFDARVEP